MLSLASGFHLSASSWWDSSQVDQSDLFPLVDTPIAYTLSTLFVLSKKYRAENYPELCERAWGTKGSFIASILIFVYNWYAGAFASRFSHPDTKGKQRCWKSHRRQQPSEHAEGILLYDHFKYCMLRMQCILTRSCSTGQHLDQPRIRDDVVCDCVLAFLLLPQYLFLCNHRCDLLLHARRRCRIGRAYFIYFSRLLTRSAVAKACVYSHLKHRLS